MLASQIIKDKPQQTVITIPKNMSVREAAAILSEKRIGVLVVSKDGKHLEGIVSERDLVRDLGKCGADCLVKPVSDLMTENVQTCDLTTSAKSLMEIMTLGKFRHIPVMDNDELVGLISIGDVVKARLSQIKSEKDALQDMIMGN